MAERLLTDFLCCHICSEIFKEPVSLRCNHSFCRTCVHQFWEKTKSRNCPICKRRSSMDDPGVNVSLKELADSYTGRKKAGLAERKEIICSKHTERPMWFCVDEGTAVCSLCESPKHHSSHTVIPVEEAVSDLKEKLKRNLTPMQDQLVKCRKIKTKYEDMVQHTKKQLVATERQIKAEFEELHQFLQDEEEARLAALREEEEQKGKTMSEKLKIIQEQISSLSDRISAVEQELKEEDIAFLKKYKQTSVRAQCTLQDPQLLSGALIDVAKHLGNLRFRVWEKMLGMVQYTPVILDPNTAHAYLSLSEDLTSVRYTGVNQQLPDNPERFDYCVNVLGSEGFTSGKHSWEVEVGNNPEWDVGVAKESINRKGKITYSPGRGFWVIVLRNGDEYIAGGGTPLTLKRKPQRIRVQLDYDRGEVSFYDSSDMSHIYTFKDTFTERLFPYFNPGVNNDGSNPGALQICPVKVSITVNENCV
ncbi:zinc-binding protein A33-like [Megalops cyprinoides]|uniref:zinc-binding protein A33-like n=1 Tax=Megalops cyprinoides TaxID=118141 RepID=UPI0018656705|nr:zinc-binding protein A33-like [Megalops cyprinoides]